MDRVAGDASPVLAKNREVTRVEIITERISFPS